MSETMETRLESGLRMAAMAVMVERMRGDVRDLPTWALVGMVVDHESPFVSPHHAPRMAREKTLGVACIMYADLIASLEAGTLGTGGVGLCPPPPGEGECICVVSLRGVTQFGVMPCGVAL